MNEYLFALIVAGALTALASFLLPEDGGALGKTVEFGMGLLLLLLILRPLSGLCVSDAPFLELFSGVGEITAENALLTPETQKELEAAVAQGIVSDLSDRFRIPEGCIRATPTLALRESDLTLTALTLHISGVGQAADLRAMRRYVEENYRAECEVITDAP